MPNYQYVAQNAAGKRVKGSAAAADRQELHGKLMGEGLLLISAEEIGRSFRGKAIRPQSLSDFNRQVGQLVSSGVSLVRALSIISQQESLRPEEEDAYRELLYKIRQGTPMSKAMEEMGNVFPELMINMYRSAEASGNLDQVAKRMAIHYDKEWRLNTKVKNSTLYPKILSVLIVAVLIIIMTFVLPQFADMFAMMPSLPLPTVILMAISDFVGKYWVLLVIGAVAARFGFGILLRNPDFRRRWDKLMLSLPVFGKLQRVICTARFARTLSSLYSSGLPLVSGLEIARHTTGNSYIDSQFDSVIPKVRSGENLSDCLRNVDGFIKKLEFSIRVGEETGALDAMLESTADALDYESEMALERMVGYLEPAMIVFMAVIVGFIMIAVIVPIYGSYETIGAGY